MEVQLSRFFLLFPSNFFKLKKMIVNFTFICMIMFHLKKTTLFSNVFFG